MRRTVPPALALACWVSVAGCSSGPAADAVKPVPPPAALVGKWQAEQTDGTSSRTTVHHFLPDGRVETDTRIRTPGHLSVEMLKRAVVKVEADRVTLVDLASVGGNGSEEAIPADRRRERTFRVQATGDELRWSELDGAGQPAPGAEPVVLKRVRE